LSECSAEIVWTKLLESHHPAESTVQDTKESNFQNFYRKGAPQGALSANIVVYATVLFLFFYFYLDRASEGALSTNIVVYASIFNVLLRVVVAAHVRVHLVCVCVCVCVCMYV